MKIGHTLKNLRESKWITRTSLASDLNIDKTTYGKYELNQRVPDVEMLIKLADFFEVSLDYLTGRSDIMNPYTILSEDQLLLTNQEEIEVVSIWRQLKYEEKTIIKGKMFEIRKLQQDIQSSQAY